MGGEHLLVSLEQWDRQIGDAIGAPASYTGSPRWQTAIADAQTPKPPSMVTAVNAPLPCVPARGAVA